MKKFFAEFKTFITRGNVLDMSVGVIVGGAFTGIVNALSDHILKPIINWILSALLKEDGLEGAVTFLSKKFTKDTNGLEVVDLANSIYIDWGAFISAIINFFLIAFVLFSIVKFVNGLRDGNEKAKNKLLKERLTKEDRKILKERKISLRNRKAVAEYLKEKQEAKALAEETAKKEQEEKEKAERLANPTSEDLLKQILQVLEEQKQ